MYFDSYATGKRIQQLRKANGMTQEQFAIELNTSDRHIRRIERGEETPSIDLYVEMVATFNTSLDYLLLGKAPSEREEQLKRQLYAKLHRIARNLDQPQSCLSCAGRWHLHQPCKLAQNESWHPHYSND